MRVDTLNRKGNEFDLFYEHHHLILFLQQRDNTLGFYVVMIIHTVHELHSIRHFLIPYCKDLTQKPLL